MTPSLFTSELALVIPYVRIALRSPTPFLTPTIQKCNPLYQNFKTNLEFPADSWEVRCTSRSSQFYIKHLGSGREFLSVGDARALARTLPNYVAPPSSMVDPFGKRRTYPFLDRSRNSALSHEFPEEFWEVRKQPLSGHCYLKHLESCKEFLRTEVSGCESIYNCASLFSAVNSDAVSLTPSTSISHSIPFARHRTLGSWR